jgi:hypothetical protein
VNHDVAVLGAHGENAVETGRLGEHHDCQNRVRVARRGCGGDIARRSLMTRRNRRLTNRE